MLGAAKQKGCFLYTSKQKYFDLSPSLFGALYGYADKFSSTTIKKHLSKRSHLLKFSQAKLPNFFRSQLSFLLRSCDGRELPDYFCPILISNSALLTAMKSGEENQKIHREKNTLLDEEFLNQLDELKTNAKVFYDHDIVFEQKKIEKPHEAIAVVLGFFPYFAEIVLHMQEINISPTVLLCSSRHSFFLKNCRLAIVDTRNSFAKQLLKHAADEPIDLWQLFVYIDIIKHHHKSAKVPSYQRSIKYLKGKIDELSSLKHVKIDFPKMHFPTGERFFNVNLTKEKMQQLLDIQEKIQAKSSVFAHQQRLFLPTLSVFRKDLQLQIALALSHEWNHLEGRVKKLKSLLS